MEGKWLLPVRKSWQEAQKKLLEKEGFKIVQMGKNYKVEDFEQYLEK